MAAETPCSVLYNDIRSFGGLKRLEIARMLINGNSYLGSTLLEKCSSNRSYLTRYIVHRKPDQCAPAIYSDFTVTTLNLSAAICSKLGGGESAYQAIRRALSRSGRQRNDVGSRQLQAGQPPICKCPQSHRQL